MMTSITDIAIIDGDCNCGYRRKVIFPITNMSDITNNQITYHKHWDVWAPINAVTEAMNAYGNSEPVCRSSLIVHTNGCFHEHHFYHRFSD